MLLDSPPIASVTDGLLLARHADMSVLVVQHNQVDKKVIRRSVAAMRKVTESLIGAVLNAVDIKTQGYYYYYYPQNKPKTADGAQDASRSGAGRLG